MQLEPQGWHPFAISLYVSPAAHLEELVWVVLARAAAVRVRVFGCGPLLPVSVVAVQVRTLLVLNLFVWPVHLILTIERFWFGIFGCVLVEKVRGYSETSFCIFFVFNHTRYEVLEWLKNWTWPGSRHVVNAEVAVLFFVCLLFKEKDSLLVYRSVNIINLKAVWV